MVLCIRITCKGEISSLKLNPNKNTRHILDGDNSGDMMIEYVSKKIKSSGKMSSFKYLGSKMVKQSCLHYLGYSNGKEINKTNLLIEPEIELYDDIIVFKSIENKNFIYNNLSDILPEEFSQCIEISECSVDEIISSGYECHDTNVENNEVGNVNELEVDSESEMSDDDSIDECILDDDLDEADSEEDDSEEDDSEKNIKDIDLDSDNDDCTYAGGDDIDDIEHNNYDVVGSSYTDSVDNSAVKSEGQYSEKINCENLSELVEEEYCYPDDIMEKINKLIKLKNT